MTLQASVKVRNARLDAIETAIGPGARLRLFSGPAPATTSSPDSGVALAVVDLPADFMAVASNGAKSMLGTWSDSSADASGRAGHYRIYDSAGACDLQGLAAGPWTPSTAYALGDQVTSDGGKVYRATTAGNSAASGAGPSGVGAGVADGGAVWTYVQAAPDMALDNGAIVAGQSFVVTSYVITDGNG